MNQVLGGVAPLKSSVEALRIQGICFYDLDLVPPRIQRQLFRITRHTPHLEAMIKQSRNEPTTDVAGGAGDENLHSSLRLPFEASPDTETCSDPP